jgi:GNAT superfamily N-acetyltransferase
MNILIRQATIDDVQTLLDINFSSFEANATYDPYIDMNWTHTDNAKKYFQKAITAEGYYAIVAFADDTPVGFLFLGPKQLTYRTVKMIELDILAVLPRYRSQGVGKMLVDEAKRWAKSKGYQTIYASSYYMNTRSHRFYEREGFSLIDVGLEVTL